MADATNEAGSDGWTGTWVTERLGVRLVGRGSSPAPPTALAGLAVRRNPRRAHLVVSPVLGKHVPVDPWVARRAAEDLGQLVAQALDDDTPGAAPLVVGFAETATGLGHCVSDVLGGPYLHSTRRTVAGRSPLLGFEEQHSHASSHHLVPDDPTLLDMGGPVVLVDDELTTGATAANTIRALENRSHHPTYVVAALLDLRPDAAAEHLDRCADDLGVRVLVVSGARGEVELPPDVLDRNQRLVASLPDAVNLPQAIAGRHRRVVLTGDVKARQGGRYGFKPEDRMGLDAALPEWTRAVVDALDQGDQPTRDRSVHVLGTEELMYLPLRLGCELAVAMPDARVTFSSTTRSPIAIVDVPGYAVRNGLTFVPHDDTGEAPRFAYNLPPGRFDHLVVVLDAASDTTAAVGAGGLVEALTRVAPDVVVVVLPEPGGGPR